MLPRTLHGVIAFATTASLRVSSASGRVLSGGSLVPPDFDTFSPPAAGSTYSDPVFGTPILRVSDALQTENNADGGNLTFVINEYATMSPFNEDGTLLLLQHESYFALYDEQGSYVKDLPFDVDASSEPRWSRAETELLSGSQSSPFSSSAPDPSSGPWTIITWAQGSPAAMIHGAPGTICCGDSPVDSAVA